jgi:hypothetical protein
MGVFWKNRKRILWRRTMVEGILGVIFVLYVVFTILKSIITKGE